MDGMGRGTKLLREGFHGGWRPHQHVKVSRYRLEEAQITDTLSYYLHVILSMHFKCIIQQFSVSSPFPPPEKKEKIFHAHF